MKGLRFWSISFVLIMLRTLVQTKALTFEGALNYQVDLSKEIILYLEWKSRSEIKIYKRKSQGVKSLVS